MALEVNTSERSPLQKLIDERLPSGVETLFALIPMPEEVSQQINAFLTAKEDAHLLHELIVNFRNTINEYIREDHKFVKGCYCPTESLTCIHCRGNWNRQVNASGNTCSDVQE
jgi:hypothetical protein